VELGGWGESGVGEGFFEVCGGSDGGVGPVAVLIFGGEGVDGGLGGLGEFVLIVGAGGLVLFLVKFGGRASGFEFRLAVSELTLKVSAAICCLGEGSNRGGVCAASGSCISLSEFEFEVGNLPTELSALGDEPGLSSGGAFIFSTECRAPVKDVLVTQEEFGGEGVGWEGEGGSSRGALLGEDGVEFADPVLLSPEEDADPAEFVPIALGFSLRSGDGRGGAFSALESSRVHSAGSASPCAFTFRREDGDRGEGGRRGLSRGGHEPAANVAAGLGESGGGSEESPDWSPGRQSSPDPQESGGPKRSGSRLNRGEDRGSRLTISANETTIPQAGLAHTQVFTWYV
jgi:hypothetical protein